MSLRGVGRPSVILVTLTPARGRLHGPEEQRCCLETASVSGGPTPLRPPGCAGNLETLLGARVSEAVPELRDCVPEPRRVQAAARCTPAWAAWTRKCCVVFALVLLAFLASKASFLGIKNTRCSRFPAPPRWCPWEGEGPRAGCPGSHGACFPVAAPCTCRRGPASPPPAPWARGGPHGCGRVLALRRPQPARRLQAVSGPQRHVQDRRRRACRERVSASGFHTQARLL